MNFSWVFYIAGNILLIAVLIIGERINGATRWIRIGIQFQPSDLVKIILILFLPLGSCAVSIAMKFIPDLICLPSERHRYFK